MSRAECVSIPAGAIRAIAGKYGLGTRSIGSRPWIGATSCVYPVGRDLVLKVPYDEPAAIASVRTESAVVPFAIAVGIRTPSLLAYDPSLELLPVPYAIYERVRGVPLGSLDLKPASVGPAWRGLGRDLALAHGRVSPEEPLASLRSFHQSPELDPRPWVGEIAASGRLSAPDARWLCDLLHRLAPAALAPVQKRFCHGDANASNVMVRADTHEYVAVLDWAGAGWLDPAWDFAGVDPCAVPYMLAGHREVAPMEGDDTAEHRILWCHLQQALFHLRRELRRAQAPELRIDRLVAKARMFAGSAGIL